MVLTLVLLDEITEFQLSALPILLLAQPMEIVVDLVDVLVGDPLNDGSALLVVEDQCFSDTQVGVLANYLFDF